MKKITYKKASLKDKEQIYNILSALEEVQLDKREFNKIFTTNISDSNIHYLVAVEGSLIIGFASLHIQKLLHHVGNIAELQEIYVLPSLRGQGIGAKMLAKLKSIAKQNHCKNLEVSCNITRKKTHKFYIREGLKKTHFKFVEQL